MSPLPYQYTSSFLGKGAPGTQLQLSAHRPFPKSHGWELPAGLSAVAKPTSCSLGYRAEKDMEIETGEERAGPEGSQGCDGKTAQPG